MSEMFGTIVVNAPYSVALDALERRLRAKKNRLTLSVPLKALGLGGSFGLEQEVSVHFVSFRGHKGERRLHDEMQLTWDPTGGVPFPSFKGALKMHPLGSDTEMELNGEYTPPLGAVGEVFDAVIGKKIAEVTANALLGELKEAIEVDFAAVKDTIEKTPPG